MILALKETQDSLCQLPKKIEDFVGREEKIKMSKESLEDGKFVFITGGPCYGKSSLANELGHALFKKPYDFVVWISMRDIASSPPTLEDVARNILKEFEIDTTEMEDSVIDFLIRKFESITSGEKTALLIFDNADDLIAPQDNTSCGQSTFTKLSRIIRGNSRGNSISAIFTTRVCYKPDNDEHQQIMLNELSNDESRTFLDQELAELNELDREEIVNDLVDVGRGLPFALRLICSSINEMQSKQMIEDYLYDLKKDPLETVSENSGSDNFHLYNLFDLSLNRLDEKDAKLLSLLAVFPSRFSYGYVKKLIAVLKDDTIGARMLKNLEKHSMIQDFSRVSKTIENESSTEECYGIHPFLCQYLKKKYWADGKGQIYEMSYYSLYIQQLFILSINALEKDNYVNCLKEFQTEQHNFFYVMTQIGKGLEGVNQSNHLKEIFCEELNQKTTPDYIAACLFCIDLTNPSLLLRFFEGCEALVDEKLKKNIWCCRYDLNMKYYKEKVDDPHKQLEPDAYGRAVLDKQNIAEKMYESAQVKDDFTWVIDDLDALKERMEKLECKKMKAYFMHKILKLKADWLKKKLKPGTLDDSRNDCLSVFKEALEICIENFGGSWFTIDCYNQVGKLHWRLKETEEATLAFDKAIELAESMSLKNIKKFGACLLNKGRFLIDSGIEEKKAEGRALLENVIEGCKDFSEINFWCRAMSFLLKVDKSKAVIVKERFCDTDKLNNDLLAVMDEAIRMNSDSFDVCIEEESLWKDEEEAKVKNLCEAIEHLENILESSSQEYDANDNDNTSLLKDANKHLFVWQMKAALKYNHILPLSERKIFAKKALDIMESCPFIDRKKEDDLRRLVNYECSLEGEDLLRERHYIDLLSKPLLKEGKHDELMGRYSKLLGKCEDYQEIWSSIVLKISRDNPVFYKDVTALLIRQPEPCEDLLKLVHYKFQYDIRIYERKSDESIIMRESQDAVEDLEKAIKHVEKLLNEGDSLETNLIKRLEECLQRWYKDIAFTTEHCLLNNDRVRYAKQIHPSNLSRDGKLKLSAILSRNCTTDEQEQIRKKSLLMKVTQFMRENGMQDELERRYEAFLNGCSSFPRLQFELVKYIVGGRNVEDSNFTRYLTFLPPYFQDRDHRNGWDYTFVIDLADDLFSNKIDQSSRRKSFEICHSIYTHLSSSKKFTSDLRRKLEFEFLVVFSLKIGNDVRNVIEKKKDAQHALDIFPDIGAQYKDDPKLSLYKKQLEDLLDHE